MSAVSLQNSVRIRIILILSFSILITLIVPLTSDGIIKAVSLSSMNNFFYFAVLICSIIPSKIAWIVACIILVLASILDLIVFFLSFLVTLRCLEEGGCMNTLPFSLVVLGLVGLVTLLDLYQTWNVYLILQNKTYVASATQRLRVVLTWAIPFVLLSNVAMVANDEFAVLGIIPLISLPIVIFLAHKNEGTFLGLLLVITLISIAFTLFSVSSELATQALMTEGILTAFGLVLLSVPNEYYIKTPLEPEPDIHILPAFSVNNKKPQLEASEFKASEALIPKQIRKRVKPPTGSLKF